MKKSRFNIRDKLRLYTKKQGSDWIVLWQLNIKERIKYFRLTPFQRQCFNGVYCSCLRDFTYQDLMIFVRQDVLNYILTMIFIGIWMMKMR